MRCVIETQELKNCSAGGQAKRSLIVVPHPAVATGQLHLGIPEVGQEGNNNPLRNVGADGAL